MVEYFSQPRNRCCQLSHSKCRSVSAQPIASGRCSWLTVGSSRSGAARPAIGNPETCTFELAGGGRIMQIYEQSATQITLRSFASCFCLSRNKRDPLKEGVQTAPKLTVKDVFWSCSLQPTSEIPGQEVDRRSNQINQQLRARQRISSPVFSSPLLRTWHCRIAGRRKEAH